MNCKKEGDLPHESLLFAQCQAARSGRLRYDSATEPLEEINIFSVTIL